MKKYLFFVLLVGVLSFSSCKKNKSGDDNNFKEIFAVQDSLQKLDFRSFSTLVPDLDLRISPNEFDRILEDYTKRGVLRKIKDSVGWFVKKDTLITTFKMNVNDTLTLDFKIGYESLLDRIYSISYVCKYNPKNEEEYNLIHSFLIDHIRNQHLNLIEFNPDGYGIIKGRQWMKGNISVGLNIYDWNMYKSSSEQAKNIWSFSVNYSDLHYLGELESYLNDYLENEVDYDFGK